MTGLSTGSLALQGGPLHLPVLQLDVPERLFAALHLKSSEAGLPPQAVSSGNVCPLGADASSLGQVRRRQQAENVC